MKRLLYFLIFMCFSFSASASPDKTEISAVVASLQEAVQNKSVDNNLNDFFSPSVKIYVKNKPIKAPYDGNWFLSLNKIIATIYNTNDYWNLSFSHGKDKTETFQWIPVSSLSNIEQMTWADIHDMNNTYAVMHIKPAKMPYILNTMIHFCVSTVPSGSCDVLRVDEEVAALFEYKENKWLVTHITGSPNADVTSSFMLKTKLYALLF